MRKMYGYLNISTTHYMSNTPGNYLFQLQVITLFIEKGDGSTYYMADEQIMAEYLA